MTVQDTADVIALPSRCIITINIDMLLRLVGGSGGCVQQ